MTALIGPNGCVVSVFPMNPEGGWAFLSVAKTETQTIFVLDSGNNRVQVMRRPS